MLLASVAETNGKVTRGERQEEREMENTNFTDMVYANCVCGVARRSGVGSWSPEWPTAAVVVVLYYAGAQ